MAFDEFGRGFLEQELGDESGGDLDEFEFGGAFVVYSLHLEMHWMSLEILLMSLGVGLERELGGE